MAENHTPIVVSPSIVRFQRDSFVVAGDRFIKALEVPEGIAPTNPNFRKIRLQGECHVKSSKGFVVAFKIIEEKAAVVVSLSRFLRDGFVVASESFIKALEGPENIAAIYVSVSVVRIQRDSLVVTAESFIKTLEVL